MAEESSQLINLFYRKVGEGQPLIILHGLFGMSDNWMMLSKQFAEQGFSVYTPDARNHGQSPHSDEINYRVMADDILELIEGQMEERTEGQKSFNIIGHSMGGKTAMWLACEHPEKVSKLIIVDMAPKSYLSPNKNVIDAVSTIDLSAITKRKEVESKLKEILQDEATIQFLLKNVYWKEEGVLSWRFNFKAIKKNIGELNEALPESFHYNGPTLFLRGAKSNYITDVDKDLMLHHFPQATIKTIPDAGHWVHAENPAGFMQAVLDFLTA